MPAIPEVFTVGQFWVSRTIAGLVGLRLTVPYALCLEDGSWYKPVANEWTRIGSGVQGPKGDTGVQGPPGPTGAQGSAGNLGATWTSGSGVPINAVGVNGDYYLNTTNGDVYKKAAGTYSVTGNIKGATGVQRAVGPQGNAGPQGITGNIGTSGPQGTIGPTGNTGAQGLTGSQGPTGSAGTQGIQGIQGPAGNTSDTVKSLPVDAATNSTVTAAKITGLDQIVAPGIYTFQYFIRYQSALVTTGVKFSVNHTGTVTVFLVQTRHINSVATITNAPSQNENLATAAPMQGHSARAKSNLAGLGPTLSVDVINADMMMVIEGLMIVTVSGNLELWHASEVAAASTVKAGSSLILTKTG